MFFTLVEFPLVLIIYLSFRAQYILNVLWKFNDKELQMESPPPTIVCSGSTYWHFHILTVNSNIQTISVILNPCTSNLQNPAQMFRQCTVLSLWSKIQFQIGSTWKVVLPLKVTDLITAQSQTHNAILFPRLQGISNSPVKNVKYQQFSTSVQFYHLHQFYAYTLFSACVSTLSFFPKIGLHL